jgi:hypothetical protein
MRNFAQYCRMLRYGDADEHEIYHAVMMMMCDDAFWHEWCVDGRWHT